MAEYILLSILEQNAKYKDTFKISCDYLLDNNFITPDMLLNKQLRKKEYKKFIQSISVENNESISDIQTTLTHLSHKKNSYINFQEDVHTMKNIISYGSYGIVLKTKHKLDKHIYAIKIIAMNDNDDKIQEIEILRKLKHKNIVRYFYSWMSNKEYQLPKNIRNKISNYDDKDIVLYHQPQTRNRYTFIQMEYCKKTLAEWLINRIYPPNEKSIIMQLFRGIHYLHTKNILHGDLKTNNIFIKGSIIKIGDFGLSQINQTDFSDDIYKLGLICFELLYPMQTQMEKVVTIENIKMKRYPSDFSTEYVEIIKYMLSGHSNALSVIMNAVEKDLKELSI